jgi:hypothetical protein
MSAKVNAPHLGECVMTRSDLLETVASIWKPHQARTRWCDDGFDWSPGSHLIRIRVVPPQATEPGQPERWGLWAQTELLNSPPIDQPEFGDRLAAGAPFITSMYALVYPPHFVWQKYFGGEPPVLRLFSSVYVSDEMREFLPQLLCQVALLQAVSAEFQSERLAEGLGGKPAFIGSRKARDRDEILDTAHAFYAGEGAKPSRWEKSDEFDDFVDEYGECDACFGDSNEAGMTLETPFGDDSAVIQFRSDEPHRQLGNGLRVSMRLPPISSEEGVVVQAAYLNFLEAKFWTGVPQLGCWYVDSEAEEMSVVHSCFVPNALYVEGLAGNLALYCLDRARWARKHLLPKVQDKPMGEIIDQRTRSGLYR